jgi:hypothetical protein
VWLDKTSRVLKESDLSCLHSFIFVWLLPFKDTFKILAVSLMEIDREAHCWKKID